MEPMEAIEVGREAIWVLLKVAGPIMLVSLAVGLVIALLQALTQIQEMTLTFVPKIVAIFLTLMVMMPYIFTTLKDFTHDLAERIVRVEPDPGGDVDAATGE